MWFVLNGFAHSRFTKRPLPKHDLFDFSDTSWYTYQYRNRHFTLTKKLKNTFTNREVADSCNNLVLRSLRPAALGEIPEKRLQKLRAYSQALLAPMIKHMDEELLRPEEVVMVLATAALFTQLRYVLHSVKVPMGISVHDLYEGPEAVVLPEAYYATPEPVSDPGGPSDEILPRVGKTRNHR